ncbi:MAG: hypothetical protein AAF623_21490 [Planctomycetota bacterium]
MLRSAATLTFMALSAMLGLFVHQDSFGQLAVSLPTPEQRSPAASFNVSLDQSDGSRTVTLTIEAVIADGWHIYPTKKVGLNIPTTIKFEGAGFKPLDDGYKLEYSGNPTKELAGSFKWTRQFELFEKAKSFSGEGSIKFQACDSSKCLPPSTLKFQFGSATIRESHSETMKKKVAGETITLSTESCSLTRPPATFSMGSLFSGPRTEKLHRKCSIKVQGQLIDIYLPEAEKYTTKNTGSDNTRIDNTSTYISIDQNGDGVLASHEAVPTNLPIRILDSMYRVTAIAEDASSISLVASDGPLFGVVMDRKCPEFSFQTIDHSRTISNESILGKVTLLDIWAVT